MNTASYQLATEGHGKQSISAKPKPYIEIRIPGIGKTTLGREKAEWILSVVQAAFFELDDVDELKEESPDVDIFKTAYTSSNKESRRAAKALCMATMNLGRALSKLEEIWESDIVLYSRFAHIRGLIGLGSPLNKVTSVISNGIALPPAWEYNQWGPGAEAYHPEEHFHLIDVECPNLRRDMKDLEELLLERLAQTTERHSAGTSTDEPDLEVEGLWTQVPEPRVEPNDASGLGGISICSDPVDSESWERISRTEAELEGNVAYPGDAEDALCDQVQGPTFIEPEWTWNNSRTDDPEPGSATSEQSEPPVDLTRLDYGTADYILGNIRKALYWTMEMKSTKEYCDFRQDNFVAAHDSSDAIQRLGAQALCQQTISLPETLYKLQEPTRDVSGRFEVILSLLYPSSKSGISLKHIRNRCAHMYGVPRSWIYDHRESPEWPYSAVEHWKFIRNIVPSLLPALEEAEKAVEEVLQNLQIPEEEEISQWHHVRSYED